MTPLGLALARLRPAFAALSLPRSRLHGRSRSRRAVLTGLAALIVAHLGLALAVETRRPQWRDPEFFVRQQRLATVKEFMSHPPDRRPVLAILGGSRPEMGLSPEMIFRACPCGPLPFNCSQSGCLPIGEWLNFTRLIDAGVEPEYLLIEVLPPVLTDPGPMEDRIPTERLSAKDLVNLRPFHEKPDRIRPAWLKNRIASWYSLRLPLMASAGLADVLPFASVSPHHNWTACTDFGWVAFYPRQWTAADRDPRFAVARASYSNLMRGFTIQPVNDRIYRTLLDSCRKRGIRVALFTMPESPAFRDCYPPGVRETISTYLVGLAAEYRVPFFDTSGWIDNEDAFTDGHHLLGPAAEQFSERFGRECVRPWVTR